MSTELAKRDAREIDLPGFRLTATGAVRVGKPTQEQWSAAMHWVLRCASASMFWLGDLLVMGEATYGDLASQEDGDGKYAHQTLENARYVAGKIPISRRREPISFAHHAVVASLEPAEQDHWLKKAEDEGWSEKELRKQLGIKAHVGQNAGDNDWYTPSEYIDAAREVMETIDLDPASTAAANKTVKAERFYSQVDNGLEQDWEGRVWMNPPYAQPLIAQFCDKLVQSIESGDVPESCVLVNNATETEWFQKLLSIATSVCLPCSRVKFWKPNGDVATPLQGQAVFYFGEYADHFESVFSQFGAIVRPNAPVVVS